MSQSKASDADRLRMTAVFKRFGATQALRGVNLQLKAGEVLAVVGENGAGKSTLMKILSGAISPDSGAMWLDGQPYAPRHPADAREAGVAMIYQELSLAPHLSVAENVMLGMEPRWGPWIRQNTLRHKAHQALDEVGGTNIPLDIPVRQLSVAQQQLVEIARAIATRARVLVFDEPTSSLTQQDIDQLFALIRRLQTRGIAIVYISHFLEEVKTISQRYTVLRDGESVADGTTHDVVVPDLIAAMVGRDTRELYPRGPRSRDGEILLRVDNVAVWDKPSRVSLEVRRGQVFGIAGLVGAGRTELLRVLFGLAPLRHGQVRLGTISSQTPTSSQVTPRRRWLQRVGMVSEDRKREGLASGLSIADNMTLSRLDGLGPGNWISPRRKDRAAEAWIEKLQIKCESSSQLVSALSGGNQQKVALARLLHADVDLWLLDEPTRGVDVGAKALIYQLIHELADGDPARGIPAKGILVVSSYLPELLGICDDIAVMTRGHLSQARPVDAWTEMELMQLATGLASEI